MSAGCLCINVTSTWISVIYSNQWKLSKHGIRNTRFVFYASNYSTWPLVSSSSFSSSSQKWRLARRWPWPRRNSFFVCAYTFQPTFTFHPTKTKLVRRKGGLGSSGQWSEGTCGRPEYDVAPGWTTKRSVKKKKGEAGYQRYSRSQWLCLLFRWSVERRSLWSAWIYVWALLGNGKSEGIVGLTPSNSRNR